MVVCGLREFDHNKIVELVSDDNQRQDNYLKTS